MAIKEGTKAAKSVNVIKATGSIRKVRCPYDQENTLEEPDGKGGTQQRCPSCKRLFSSTAI